MGILFVSFISVRRGGVCLVRESVSFLFFRFQKLSGKSARSFAYTERTERGGREMEWKGKLIWGLWGVALLLSLAALLTSPPEAVSASAEPGKGCVALTFDDGPWPETTERLLDGLAQRGAKATFFVIGSQIEGQEDTLRRMVDEGHQVGLHTWDHVQLKGLTPEKIRAELSRTREALETITGPESLMLRPPYGFADSTLQACAGVPIIIWSVDTEDWRDKTVSRIVQTALDGAEDGAIILMHDIYDTSVTAALEIADRLMAEGYWLVTVEQLFALHGVTPETGQVYLSAADKGDAP